MISNMKMMKKTSFFLMMVFLALVCLVSCQQKGKKTVSQPPQNFNLMDVIPAYTNDEAQFDVRVFFTQPVEEEEAVKIFDPDFVKTISEKIVQLKIEEKEEVKEMINNESNEDIVKPRERFYNETDEEYINYLKEFYGGGSSK